jgi:hypothetical protein
MSVQLTEAAATAPACAVPTQRGPCVMTRGHAGVKHRPHPRYLVEYDRLRQMTPARPDLQDVPARELEREVLAASDRPCVGRTEDYFLAEPDTRSMAARRIYEALARALCHGCPVAAACLELTVQREGPAPGHGIAGSTSPRQRQAIKRARGWAIPGGAS